VHTKITTYIHHTHYQNVTSILTTEKNRKGIEAINGCDVTNRSWHHRNKGTMAS